MSQFKIAVLFTANVSQSTRAISNWANNTETKLKTLEKGFQGFRDAGVASMAGGAAIGGGLAFVAKKAVDFEDSMGKAMSISGLTGDAYTKTSAKMQTEALSLSKKLNVSADQIAGGFYSVVSATGELGSKSSKDLTVASIKMADLADQSVDLSVKMISGVTNAFKVAKNGVADYGRVANVVFAGSAMGAAEVPELADSMKVVGTTAAGMGKTLEETTAILIGMSNVNLKGAEAGTAFRQMLTRLGAPTKIARKVMKDLNLEVYDSRGKLKKMPEVIVAMQKAFKGMTDKQKFARIEAIAGSEAMTAFAAVLGMDARQITAYQKKLETQRMLDDAFAQKQKSTAAQLKKLGNQFNIMAIQIGNTLLPAINEMVAKVAPMAEKLGAWIAANPKLTKQIVMAAAAIGGFLIVGGGALALVGQIGLGVTALVGVIGSMSGPLGMVAGGFKTFGKNIFLSGKDMNTAFPTVGKIGRGIVDLGNKAKGAAWKVLTLGGRVKALGPLKKITGGQWFGKQSWGGIMMLLPIIIDLGKAVWNIAGAWKKTGDLYTALQKAEVPGWIRWIIDHAQKLGEIIGKLTFNEKKYNEGMGVTINRTEVEKKYAEQQERNKAKASSSQAENINKARAAAKEAAQRRNVTTTGGAGKAEATTTTGGFQNVVVVKQGAQQPSKVKMDINLNGAHKGDTVSVRSSQADTRVRRGATTE